MDAVLMTRLADCFNHEHQARASEESAEVLGSLMRRMAACIEDEAYREAFVNVATMSGLRAERYRTVMAHPDEPVSIYDTEHPDEPLVYTARNADEAEQWIAAQDEPNWRDEARVDYHRGLGL
jgi:hypothetical protein